MNNYKKAEKMYKFLRESKYVISDIEIFINCINLDDSDTEEEMKQAIKIIKNKLKDIKRSKNKKDLNENINIKRFLKVYKNNTLS